MSTYELKRPFLTSAYILASNVSVGNITELKVGRISDSEIGSLVGALYVLHSYFAKWAVVTISSSGILAFSPEKQDTLRKASGVTVFVRYASVYEQTDPGMINIMNGLPANRPPMTKQQIKEATEVADRMRELL
ncbi:MAG TPA: hypothetical protein PLP07_05640 [Pyrinomonadaceae bacterium]|nr:hypothetical protein [Chloracidobacterium sp.]MBP9935775.1 hypothetical protein [Pyrinomonadaceae bacterium]MBK7801274.1 hypothetical protein [Chloracidobacterium sp.]MBK9436593.1 hypothetical protein [Chloracidobacterium sp.]MBK9767490.1 hypothetical protein [Chloracidobacterium sp.]